MANMANMASGNCNFITGNRDCRDVDWYCVRSDGIFAGEIGARRRPFVSLSRSLVVVCFFSCLGKKSSVRRTQLESTVRNHRSLKPTLVRPIFQTFGSNSWWLFYTLTSLVLVTAAAQASAQEPKLNVVLIVIDDLGWADLGCYGSRFYKTPNIDRLANEGMRFTQAYDAAPVGLPTRAAILTGRYPQRMMITAPFAVDADESRRRLSLPEVNRQLPLTEVTVAEVLKSASYTTACIGKWNLGGQGFGPKEQGFDLTVAGEATGAKYNDFAPYADENGNLIPGLEQAPSGEFLTDRLAIEAAKFISDHRSEPFFLYLPHFAVHMPASAKPAIVAEYGPMPMDPKGGQINPVYAALIESMDEAVGRVIKTLDSLNLSQRTLILFTSDNGGVCNGNGQIISSTSNAPLRDGMGHLYEGGLRIPLIVKWPGVIKPGSVSHEIVSCIDCLPTIMEACAVSSSATVADHPIDGISLLSVLKGGDKLAREAIYWHFPHYGVNAGAKPGAAIRSDDWKFIEFYETGRRELFQIGKDLGESYNVVEQNPEIADRLSSQLDAWRLMVGAKRPVENPGYIPNLQNEDGSVSLHSSTADVFGQMLRYEPLPHKDTLGYWVRQDDWASFEYTLKRPGQYHLIAHVGCGTDGGSLVHFETAGQTLPLTVPATGHFQKFVPQNLGVVVLDQPGRYLLTVKCQTLEGAAVMDLRKIELKPVTTAEMLPELHLLEPFWRSETVYRESVLFVQDSADQPAIGQLLFPATKILSIHSADGRKQFQQQADFTLNDGHQQLIRQEASPIPYLKASDLFMPKGARPVWAGGAQPAVPCALSHKAGDPETHVLFDNGHWFHDQQVEVTYERVPGQWPGTVPTFDAKKLPKTLARLKSKQKLTIGVSGDSITYGLNASGIVGAPPFMPIYPELVAAQLRASYGGEVQLVNRAVGGWGVPNGLGDLDQLLQVQPDLVIIAYGMNDVGYRNPYAYKDGIQQMISRIQSARPDAEIILVATMLGNDQWVHTPREMFPKYRDALASLCGEGVTLADMTLLWTEMLSRKRDCDLTGNGVNHPSDFGHRVYASALLSLLIEQN